MLSKPPIYCFPTEQSPHSKLNLPLVCCWSNAPVISSWSLLSFRALSSFLHKRTSVSMYVFFLSNVVPIALTVLLGKMYLLSLCCNCISSDCFLPLQLTESHLSSQQTHILSPSHTKLMVSRPSAGSAKPWRKFWQLIQVHSGEVVSSCDTFWSQDFMKVPHGPPKSHPNHLLPTNPPVSHLSQGIHWFKVDFLRLSYRVKRIEW